MKTAISIILCILMLVCVTSCGGTQSESETESFVFQGIIVATSIAITVPTTTDAPTTKELKTLTILNKYDRSKVGAYSEEKKTFLTTNARNVDITLDYPQLVGMEDKTRQQKINKMIYETILSDNNLNDNTYLDMLDNFSMGYRIELSAPDLISISFTGGMAGDGGRNCGFAHGLTFDLNTMQKLELNDFVAVDENLVNNLLASERVFNYDNPYVPDWEETILGIFRARYTAKDILDMFEYKREFYMTPTTICIMFPIEYNAGGYVWVEVPLKG